MKHSSRRFLSSADLQQEIDEITADLTELIGDFTTGYHVPDEPDDIVDALVCLGKACVIAHSVSKQPQPSQEVLDGLHQIARVMELFERDLNPDHVENAVDIMIDAIQTSAVARDSYTDYFGEYRERFDGRLPALADAEYEQALELRRYVEYAKIALEEMRLIHEAPDLKGRLTRYDEVFGVESSMPTIRDVQPSAGAAQ